MRVDNKKDQYVVDRLKEHMDCKQLYVKILDDEILLLCKSCEEIVINYFKEGVVR